MLNKIIKHTLLALVLAPVALTGCATGPFQLSTDRIQGPSDWSYVGRHASGDSYFIDYGTIRRDGDHVKVAQKHVWKTPALFCNGKRAARSGRFVGEYNCRTKQTRSLLSTAYAGPDLDGKLVFGTDASSPWRRVAPGTVSASILRAVCD